MELPKNDSGCGWLNTLEARTANAKLSTNISVDWLIIGAGYTGLSAARKLAELNPNSSIAIVEAQVAGEGASARNSGYLVDSTLNDGHMSDNGLLAYKEKYQLNKTALERVKNFVNKYQVDCDWNEAGKFHATSLAGNEDKLRRFSQTLSDCDIPHSVLENRQLSARLGTNFYRMAVHTEGGVLLQPAKLVRAMIHALPESVKLYENTPLIKFTDKLNGVEVTTPDRAITAKKILVCTNAFLPTLGIKRDRSFPLVLTASLSRPMSDAEFEEIGNPKEWGVLCAQAMGATVRLTQDRRIMMRNTAEAVQHLKLTPAQMPTRIQTHIDGIKSRFPTLPELNIEHSWQGLTCISANNANLFGSVSDNVYFAGCYNGGGIGLATMYGEELALMASGGSSDEIRQIQNRPAPKRLPPNPFLRWGVQLRLAKDRWYARHER